MWMSIPKPEFTGKYHEKRIKMLIRKYKLSRGPICMFSFSRGGSPPLPPVSYATARGNSLEKDYLRCFDCKAAMQYFLLLDALFTQCAISDTQRFIE